MRFARRSVALAVTLATVFAMAGTAGVATAALAVGLLLSAPVRAAIQVQVTYTDGQILDGPLSFGLSELPASVRRTGSHGRKRFRARTRASGSSISTCTWQPHT